MKKIIFSLIFLIFITCSVKLAVADTNISNAIAWLKNNQSTDDCFGPCTFNEHWTASAALALYLYEGNSANVNNTLSWLKPKLENFSYWFWTASGEVDIPALTLYTFASTSHLSDISGNLPNITLNLLYYQNNFYVTNAYSSNQNLTILKSSGGFSGWETNFSSDYKNFSRVEDSGDTSFALLGLISSGPVPEKNKTAAVNYLLSLQNPDGSFNLTSDSASSPLYSLGPDLDSTTALSLLALNAAGSDSSENVTNGLNYLKNSSITCFGNKNYSYTAAISAWTFSMFGETNYANSLTNYLTILQNSDGGFSDSRRFTYPTSQALDTAIASIAMEKAGMDGTIPVATIALSQQLSVNSTQRIMVSLTGGAWCTNENYIAASVTLPNATMMQLNLTFNSSSDYYENSFSPDTNGTYNVTVSAETIFFGTVSANSSFTADNIPTSTTTTTAATTTASSGGGGSATTSSETTISTTIEETTTIETTTTQEENATALQTQRGITGFASLTMPQIGAITVVLSFLVFFLMWKVILPKMSTKYHYRGS